MENSSPEQVFAEGTARLAEGKYAEAATQFEAILKTGFTSSALERNLGRAQVESGKLGEGIVHLTRAVALDRFDRAARNDLRVAQARVEAGYGVPMANPAEWGQRISSYARPAELGVASSLLLLGSLSAHLFMQVARRRRVTIVALVLGVFALVATGFSLTGRSLAVVVTEAELKQAPLESASTISALKPGMRVRVLRDSGAFTEVERTNAFRGWIPTTDLVRSPY